MQTIILLLRQDGAEQLERQLKQLPRADQIRLLQAELLAERRRSHATARQHARAQEETRRLERANQALQAPPLALPLRKSSLSMSFLCGAAKRHPWVELNMR